MKENSVGEDTQGARAIQAIKSFMRLTAQSWMCAFSFRFLEIDNKKTIKTLPGTLQKLQWNFAI